jgi:hypothetical protein
MSSVTAILALMVIGCLTFFLVSITIWATKKNSCPEGSTEWLKTNSQKKPTRTLLKHYFQELFISLPGHKIIILLVKFIVKSADKVLDFSTLARERILSLTARPKKTKAAPAKKAVKPVIKPVPVQQTEQIIITEIPEAAKVETVATEKPPETDEKILGKIEDKIRQEEQAKEEKVPSEEEILDQRIAAAEKEKILYEKQLAAATAKTLLEKEELTRDQKKQKRLKHEVDKLQPSYDMAIEGRIALGKKQITLANTARKIAAAQFRATNRSPEEARKALTSAQCFIKVSTN